MCVSAPEAINNQWRDIDCARLVKQVLRLFRAFNQFIRHLPSIKWSGVAILTGTISDRTLSITRIPYSLLNIRFIGVPRLHWG